MGDQQRTDSAGVSYRAAEFGTPDGHLRFADHYRNWERMRTFLFSMMLRRSFESFSSSARVQYPLRLSGERGITIGARVFVGSHSWLATYETDGHAGRLEIGDGTSIAGFCTLAAITHVRVGRSVLLARNVYVADHHHAYEDPTRPVIDQGLTGITPVEICDGAWLGQNVVVAPGVRIGRGAVIGANSFVSEDIEDYAVAAGSPARIVRRFAGGDARE